MAKRKYRTLSAKERERRQQAQDEVTRFLLAQSRRDRARDAVLRLEIELRHATDAQQIADLEAKLVLARSDRDQAQRVYNQTNPKFRRNAFTGRVERGAPSSDATSFETALMFLIPFGPILLIIVVAIIRSVF